MRVYAQRGNGRPFALPRLITLYRYRKFEQEEEVTWGSRRSSSTPLLRGGHRVTLIGWLIYGERSPTCSFLPSPAGCAHKTQEGSPWRGGAADDEESRALGAPALRRPFCRPSGASHFHSVVALTRLMVSLFFIDNNILTYLHLYKERTKLCCPFRLRRGKPIYRRKDASSSCLPRPTGTLRAGDARASLMAVSVLLYTHTHAHTFTQAVDP